MLELAVPRGVRPVLLTSLALLVACSGDDTGERTGGDLLPDGAVAGDGDGGDGDGGGDGDMGGDGDTGGARCEPACEQGTFCSATGECIKDSTCNESSDCPNDLLCDTATRTCVDASCGSEEFEIDFVEPNMFISLDRSCSLNQGMWSDAIDAVVQLTSVYDDQMFFGLALFPDTEGANCEQEAPPTVALGVDKEMEIQNVLLGARVVGDVIGPEYDSLHPGSPCVTNIDTAILQASQQTAFAVGDRPNYVLLITDGKQAVCPQNMGDPYTLQLIKDMAAMGTHTFIVGFGGGVDPAQLNEFAVAGREPRNDPDTWYYQADDAMQLSEALAELAASVVGCDFTLDSAPPVGEQLFVFFDDQPVPRDDPNGWSYDEANNSISFEGSACDTLQGSAELDVDVVFGCPVPSPD